MGEGIIQDVERYGVIMFVSFSVGNTGPFKEITGITTLAENLKNTFEVSGQNYNKISYIYGANGSGKTNYLAALTKMQKMIIMSTVLGANNNKITFAVSRNRTVYRYRNRFTGIIRQFIFFADICINR